MPSFKCLKNFIQTLAVWCWMNSALFVNSLLWCLLLFSAFYFDANLFNSISKIDLTMGKSLPTASFSVFCQWSCSRRESAGTFGWIAFKSWCCAGRKVSSRLFRKNFRFSHSLVFFTVGIYSGAIFDYNNSINGSTRKKSWFKSGL